MLRLGILPEGYIYPKEQPPVRDLLPKRGHLVQARSVPAFKLVTEGTREEKISAIIENKKKRMADVIEEDDPGVLKSFSRGS